MSNTRQLLCARYVIELACVLAAVITAGLPFHGLSETLAASNTTSSNTTSLDTMVLLLLFGTTWTLATLPACNQADSAPNNRLRALLQVTMRWGLAGGCATLIAVTVLDVPIASAGLILLCGWALLALLNPRTMLPLDNASLTWANDTGAAAKATFERARPGMRAIRRKPAERLSKHTIDVLGATLGILILLPVLAVCALAVRLTSNGPILFRQPRIGKNGQAFICLKFRTMTLGAQDQLHLLRQSSTQDGPAFKMPNDPRVTLAGRYLRKYSLDELPQLFNILLGDMSLVGPRPSVPSEVEEYAPWQLRRIMIKPGLTCIWQVWGRNQVSFNRWMEMDLAYIDNWSLWLDIKLIIHTIPAMAKGTGM
ncbi:MAG: lipopolysaccharide/colanic/teichoic acid biosynthesis glycosyltransferase [Planctomycetota bacterium]